MELEQFLAELDAQEVLDVATGHTDTFLQCSAEEEPEELHSTPRVAQANAIIRYSHSQASNSLTNYSFQKNNRSSPSVFQLLYQNSNLRH